MLRIKVGSSLTQDGVIYRAATIDDLHSMVSLWMFNAQHHGELEPRFQYVSDIETLTGAFLSKQFQSDDFFALIAQDGDEVIGYIAAFVMERPSIHLHRRIGFIDGLFVKPNYRRKGIGAALWEKALLQLQERKVDLIHLTVASKNPAAIRFWRRVGFDDLMIRMEFGFGGDRHNASH